MDKWLLQRLSTSYKQWWFIALLAWRKVETGYSGVLILWSTTLSPGRPFAFRSSYTPAYTGCPFSVRASAVIHWPDLVRWTYLPGPFRCFVSDKAIKLNFTTIKNICMRRSRIKQGHRNNGRKKGFIMIRYFHCYLLCSVPEYIKIKTRSFKSVPTENNTELTCVTTHSDGKNTCSDIPVLYIQATENSDLSF